MSELNGEEISKRRMPENIQRHLMRVQGNKVYLQVAHRLIWFRDECPDWGIFTDIVEGGEEAGFVVVKATITDANGKVIATGHKTESRKDFPAGFVEKCETGSVGRALAMCGFGTQFADDMDEGDRFADSPQPTRGFRPQQTPRASETGNQVAKNGDVWHGPGQCPSCHCPPNAKHGTRCELGA